MPGNGFGSRNENREGVEELELKDMAANVEDVLSNAPLITPQTDDHNDSVDASPSLSAGNLFIWALTLSAGISGMLFGYDTGVISSTLVSIGSDLSARELGTLDKSLITSATSLFALVASPVAGLLADKVGRKNIIFFADALFTIGALWQSYTATVWGMIIGRSIVGLAIGGASLIVPLYISELAPSHLRGRLVTVSLLFVTGGQVVAYIIGWLFSTVTGGWRWMVGIGAFPALLQFLLLFFMPETPRYLQKKGKEQQARAVLLKVYQSSSDHSEEIAERIIRAIKNEVLQEEEAMIQIKVSSTRSNLLPPVLQSLLFNWPHARALTITCMLQALQQLCGFNSLMYFSATIFSLLRFSSPTLTSLSIASTNFIFTIAAFYLIDRIGRRRILLITIPVMVVALLMCALAFTFVTLPPKRDASQSASPIPDLATDPTITNPTSRLPAMAILISLLLYVSPYATGLGNVPWQQSELFPLSVRSLGSSIATATNWGCNTVVGLTFLPMMEFFTPGWTFVCYAVVCAVGWVIVWYIYPETMGLGLEEVSELLKDGWGVEESLDRVERFKSRQRGSTLQR